MDRSFLKRASSGSADPADPAHFNHSMDATERIKMGRESLLNREKLSGVTDYIIILTYGSIKSY